MEPTPWPDPGTTWLIDGYNVLHAGMLRREDRAAWWTRSHRERLIDRVGRLENDAQEIWIAFDGEDEGERTPEPTKRGGSAPAGSHPKPASIRIIYARSADAWILARVRKTDRPQELAVVTADRKVADKARHHGAQIVSPRIFLDRCPPTASRDAL